jgi:hypothetical protein
MRNPEIDRVGTWGTKSQRQLSNMYSQSFLTCTSASQTWWGLFIHYSRELYRSYILVFAWDDHQRQTIEGVERGPSVPSQKEPDRWWFRLQLWHVFLPHICFRAATSSKSCREVLRSRSHCDKSAVACRIICTSCWLEVLLLRPRWPGSLNIRMLLRTLSTSSLLETRNHHYNLWGVEDRKSTSLIFDNWSVMVSSTIYEASSVRFVEQRIRQSLELLRSARRSCGEIGVVACHLFLHNSSMRCCAQTPATNIHHSLC